MLFSTTLEKSFSAIGARVQISSRPLRFRNFELPQSFSIDIQEDTQGEFFEIRFHPPSAQTLEFQPVDIQKADRHLLLMAKSEAKRAGQWQKPKFLCGHDERHWFVAAIPENVYGVCNVKTAKDALKPSLVLQALNQSKIREKNRNRRKNKGYLRQGEWFFIPVPSLRPDSLSILQNEPLIRAFGSKPHRLEYAYRTGGIKVYVSSMAPQGLTEAEYRRFCHAHPRSKNQFRVMTREPQLYAMGKVSHADHRTIILDGWHRVLMNTENQARATSNVAFLD